MENKKQNLETVETTRPIRKTKHAKTSIILENLNKVFVNKKKDVVNKNFS